MEFFKSDFLRKEFDQFQNEILPDAFKCGLCQKNACESFHWTFLVSCKLCRENQCKACKKFNIAKEIFKSLDDSTCKKICWQFYNSFFNLSPKSMQEHYQVKETVRTPKEKVYDVKS